MKSSILMAGGLSSRMGEPKAMLSWHGQSLIQYQISQPIIHIYHIILEES